MKKIIVILTLMSVLFSSLVCTADETESKEWLSQYADENLANYLLANGIEFPSNDSYWIKLAKAILQCVENGNDCSCNYSDLTATMFAKTIKDFAIDYYDVNLMSRYSLQYSLQYGEWSDDYLFYNCYSYAIGRTSVWSLIGFTTTSPVTAENIDDFSISQLANIVKMDLTSNTMGYYCTRITQYLPIESDLSSSQTLICLRKGELDYHFMRLNDDGWIHKPGNTNLLKYNTIPSNSSIWTNEYIDNYAIAHEGSTTYDSNIYYIIYATSHSYTGWTAYSSTQHRRYCECGSYETEGHNFEYIGRRLVCSSCNYLYGGGTIEPNNIDYME